ncbi:MAG: 1-deoxy-D-xylulose-5-phosphate reductoisomerase [Betaproteobacteria bacterium]
MVRMKRLAILGSTGSIGASTLAVVDRHPDRFEVVALSADRQVDRLFDQCRQYRPRFAAMADAASARQLQQKIRESGLTCEVLGGPQALEHIAAASEVDAVMAAIVGAAGLPSTLAAARAGKQLLLANKEALVMAGGLLMDAVAASGAVLLPIDSEHNAIFQALPRDFDGSLVRAGVKRLWLTASGGPFLRTSLESQDNVTPQQACAHPKWVMGRKISVDSATLMNKGLEVIEASFLFKAQAAQIEVVIHPQSIVHSLVEYADGSVLAQLGNPDMRTPIAHALAYPERIDAGVQSLDLCAIGSLQFERPDFDRFPCLRLAYRALEAGGSAPVVLNAANEVAVASFLSGRLPFTRIADLVEEVLARTTPSRLRTLDDVLAADAAARIAAERELGAVGIDR